MIDTTQKTIERITFEQISRVSKGMSKETFSQMQHVKRMLNDLDYDRPFFY